MPIGRKERNKKFQSTILLSVSINAHGWSFKFFVEIRIKVKNVKYFVLSEFKKIQVWAQ